MQQSPSNPFETNDSDIYETEHELLYEVSKTKRFINYIIDVGVITSLATVVNVLSIQLGYGDVLKDWANIVILIVMVLYYFTSEAIWGQSVGKMITRSVVVTEDGEKPSTLKILQRTFCRLIPFEAISFLFTNGWHDSISKTKVVQK